MSELWVGQWVRRPGRLLGVGGITHGPRWHFVESVVAGDAVTRCGRRMRDLPGRPFEVAEVMPLTRVPGQPQLCRGGCQREDVA